MKKFFKYLGSLMVLLLSIALILIGYLTFREFRPRAVEPVAINKQFSEQTIEKQQSISLVTYNIGYAGLGQTEDFFMDGGKTVQPVNKAMVQQNLTGIEETLKELPAMIYLFQEVDRRSQRSYEVNQEEELQKQLQLNSAFAYNFKVDYVPIPWPPIGRVESGLLTLSNEKITEAKRIALPNPFRWPVSISNLKRALLETRFPIKGTDKELVVFNLHLEAYDNGEGKIAQSKKLADVLSQEYAKGNYVIAGGDFNQVFKGSHRYPDLGEAGWVPGEIDPADLPKHFSLAYDDQQPTVRVLNKPYTGSYETSQVYVIDGFVVSDNVAVHSVKTKDEQFKYTDHQPVKMEVGLK